MAKEKFIAKDGTEYTCLTGEDAERAVEQLQNQLDPLRLALGGFPDVNTFYEGQERE